MKKLTSIVLAMLMLISVLTVAPMTVSAETSGDFVYKILNDGTAEITKYKGSATELSVPSTLNGYTVTRIGDQAFSWRENLSVITIPASVTYIDIYAFDYCQNLTNINVSENNERYSSIDGNLYNKNQTSFRRYAEGKTNTSFDIPSSVTYIYDCAFFDCDNLTSVTIPESVTSLGGGMTFYSCDNLASITIPDSITSIAPHTFGKCTNLTSVTIGKSVDCIDEEAFGDCINLKSITIPKNVTMICEKALGYYYDVEYFDDRPIKNFTIKGYAGSEAETYANENGFNFVCLEETPTNPTQVTQPTSETQATEPSTNATETTQSTEPTGTQATVETQLTEPTGDTQPTGTQATQSTDPTEQTQPTEPTTEAKTTITVKAAKTSIYVGDTTTVKATVTNPNGATTFTSSNKNIATVTSKGVVKGLKAGSVTITAKNNGESDSVKITVKQKANTISVKAAAKTVKFKTVKKKAVTVSAITVKNAKGTVAYKKASGSAKVTVNKKNGKLTVKKGTKKGTYTVKVKVTAAGNTTYKAGSKTVTVKIKVK